MIERFAFFLTFLPGLILGLTLHEASHAYASAALGDNLAKDKGRLTLNPLKHLSLLGTLALFILGFGWAKPVPVNPFNYQNPKKDYLLSSLAGPASNLAICVISALLIRMSGINSFEQEAGIWVSILIGTYFVNAILAVINLMPIPPLDGSKIWPCIIPGVKLVMPAKVTMGSYLALVMLVVTGAIEPVILSLLTFFKSALFFGV
ncbi:site-2 protease family protein [Sedimentisphaera salicampi]|nr:site-2 protease family protein [Sedimentisphaera salicampi]